MSKEEILRYIFSCVSYKHMFDLSPRITDSAQKKEDLLFSSAVFFLRELSKNKNVFVEDIKKEQTIKDTAYKFHVGYNWLSVKVREMNIPCKRHRSEVKLSVHSCKRTGEAHDMIKYLSKSFTKASIARVFGYSAERIRQICADNEEE